MRKQVLCFNCGQLIIKWPNNRKYCDECKTIAYKKNKAKYAVEYQKQNRKQINEYNRKYYSENTERCKANWRKWRDGDKENYLKQRRENYKKDPERYRGYANKHFQANKEKCCARTKQWIKDNPKRVKELKRKSYWKNREHALEYKRAHKGQAAKNRRRWVEANRLHVRIKNMHRIAMKKRAVGSYTVNEFIETCNMYNWNCLYCGKKLNESTVTADHIVPLSKGGSDYIENIVPACLSCNISKGAKSILNFLFIKGLENCEADNYATK